MAAPSSIGRCVPGKAGPRPPRGARRPASPDAAGFATKPRIAPGMAGHAIAAGAPFAWVAADTVYSAGAVEMALRRAGKGYVLGVTGAHQVPS